MRPARLGSARRPAPAPAHARSASGCRIPRRTVRRRRTAPPPRSPNAPRDRGRVGRSRARAGHRPSSSMRPMRPAATLSSIRARASGSGAASVTPTSSSPWRAASSASRTAHHSSGGEPRTAAARRSARSRPGQRHRDARDAEAEDRPASGLDVGRRPDPAAVGVDDGAADVEPQPQPAEAPAAGLAIGLVEALEHVLALLGREFRARRRPRAPRPRRHGASAATVIGPPSGEYLTAFSSRLLMHLVQTVAIGVDAERLRRSDLDVPVAVLAPNACHRVADLVGQVEVRWSRC